MSRDETCKADEVVNDLETCNDAVSEIKQLIPNAHFFNTEVNEDWPKGCYLFANSDVSNGSA